jgi:hypothetical protein
MKKLEQAQSDHWSTTREGRTDINSSILFAKQDGDSGKETLPLPAYFGGKNRVDLGQLRQVLGYEGTVEQ